MPARRVPMRRTKEVLGLKLDCGLSHRQIVAALGVSLGAVSKFGSADACVRHASGLGSACCGAAGAHDRLEPRVRASQTHPRRSWTTSPTSTSRKPCKRNRLTAFLG